MDNDVSVTVSANTAPAAAAVKSFASALDHIPRASTGVSQSLARVDAMLAQARTRSREAAIAVEEFKNKQTGIGRGASALDDLAGKFLTIGAAIGGAMKIKQFMDEMDTLADKAIQIGELPTALQRVGHAAALSGSSMEAVASAMTILERNIANGSKSTKQALERMGLDGASLMAMNLEEKFMALRDGFETAQKGGTGVADTFKLLGRGAKSMINAFSDSREGMKAAMDSAVTLNTAEFAKIQQFNDQVDTLWQNIKATVAGVAADILNTQEVVWGAISAAASRAFEEIKAAYQNVANAISTGSLSKLLFAPGKLIIGVGKATGLVDSDKPTILGAATAAAGKTMAEQDKKTEEWRKKVALGKETAAAALADQEEAADEARVAKITDEVDAARISMLPNDEQIAALKKKMADTLSLDGAADTLAEVLEAANDALADGNDKEAARLMGVYKKVQSMQREVSSLEKKDADARAEKVKEANKNVEDATKGVNDLHAGKDRAAVGTIVADSLTAVGGGGGVFTAGVSMQDKLISIAESQLNQLMIIADNLTHGGSGGLEVEPA